MKTEFTPKTHLYQSEMPLTRIFYAALDEYSELQEIISDFEKSNFKIMEVEISDDNFYYFLMEIKKHFQYAYLIHKETNPKVVRVSLERPI